MFGSYDCHENYKAARKRVEGNDLTINLCRMELDHVEDASKSALWNKIIVARNRRDYAIAEKKHMESFLEDVSEYFEVFAEMVSHEETNGAVSTAEVRCLIEEALQAKTSLNNKSMRDIDQFEADVKKRVCNLNVMDFRNDTPTHESKCKKVMAEDAWNEVFSEYKQHMCSRNDYLHAGNCRMAIIAYVHAITGWACSDNDVRVMLTQWIVDSGIKISNEYRLKAFMHYVEHRAENFAKCYMLNVKQENVELEDMYQQFKSLSKKDQIALMDRLKKDTKEN